MILRLVVPAVLPQSTTSHRRYPIVSAMSPAGWSPTGCHWTAERGCATDISSPTRLSAFTGCACPSEFNTIQYNIQYKIAVLVYIVLHGLAPQYIGPLDYFADLPGRWPLRSAGTNRLAVPPVKLTTVVNRTFPVVGPRAWKDLPDGVTSAESLSTFRQRLETHLFTKSFFWLFPLSSRPSLYYLGHFKNPG